jgi:hypothetical protein
MHVTTKEVDQDGTHILTSVVESDGPNALCTEQAKLTAKIISLQRTPSGGVQIQAALTIDEPVQVVAEAPAPVKAPTLEEQAAAYFESKGYSAEDAQAQVEKFGAVRVLAQRDKELDDQLAAALSPAKPKDDEKPVLQ